MTFNVPYDAIHPTNSYALQHYWLRFNVESNAERVEYAWANASEANLEEADEGFSTFIEDIFS